MANVDVSELLSDPDLIDCFQVKRASNGIDEHGRTASISNTYRAFGVVQPASGRTLQLAPEASLTSSIIEIWTTFGLQIITDSTASDIVTWRGKDYLVNHIDDWLSVSGFVHAICTLRSSETGATPL